LNTRTRQPPARLPTLTEVVPVQAVERSLAVPSVEQAMEPVAQPAGRSLIEGLAQALRPWVDSIIEKQLRESPTSSRDGMSQLLLEHLHRDIDPLLQEAVSHAAAQWRMARP